MPKNINLCLSLLLTKEAGEVQKRPFTQGTQKLQGFVPKAPLAGYLPFAHAKRLLAIFTCFTPCQRKGAN